MTSFNKSIRCYAKREGDLWVAVCIDFCLAAQGSSLEEAKESLEGQVLEYVEDAVLGEDKEHMEYLLSRKAPLSQRVTYHLLRVAAGFKPKASAKPDTPKANALKDHFGLSFIQNISELLDSRTNA